MLLREIAAYINVGTGSQLLPEQALQIMDACQKAAFERKLEAFLVYDRRVDLLSALPMEVADYDAPDDDDIGETVTGQDSGAVGILVSVDAVTREWRVRDAGAFIVGERVETASGAGGTLKAIGPWRGPYVAPADCRKIWGITRRPPGRFNFKGGDGTYYVNGVAFSSDYGAPSGDPAPFEGGPVNDLDRTFLFAYDPQLATPYYWVFWRGAPDIADFADSGKLLIPAAYHIQFARCCVAGADAVLSSGMFDETVVDKFLGGWHDSLRAPYRDQRGGANYTQDNLV